MDPERKGWSAELLAMVQTAGGANGSDGAGLRWLAENVAGDESTTPSLCGATEPDTPNIAKEGIAP